MTNRTVTPAAEGRIPPQNLEAEEAVLGGILLDPDALNRILDLLGPEMFYVVAHQEIFRACLALHNQSRPTDLMSVATWLADRESLDKVGGQTKLVELCDRTVSAVNIDYYAQLIADKYTRRRLVEAGREAMEIGFDTGLELPRALDLAEQKIFAVTQARASTGLTPASDILTQTFSELETRFNALGETGGALPGLATGFYDLDAMTQGFQRSDLIIVAGRPSMGKTAFGLELARRMADLHRLPVAIFSLEMSKEQLVYRLLASQTKTRSSDLGIDSSRLRAGQLGDDEWGAVANAIGILSELPIYIDDSPNPSVNELRSKCRRLQSERGGMGLVLIDYLQLMEGSGSDNRVQELSRITRSLKGLARELSVPIIALSQLSRGVEARTNKRPMLSDLRECVTGDTLVWLADGRRLPMASLVGQAPVAIAMDPQGKLVAAQAECIWEVGCRPVFEVVTVAGRRLRATGQHRLYTWDGWQPLQNLQAGDRLAVASHWPQPANPNWDTRRQVVQSYATALQSAELQEVAAADLFWDVVQSIAPQGEATVYDLTVPGPASWLADGVVCHNSGSIEQDADLVINLYRDEYYNPETPDRGIAEAIVAKHRNGPVGTVKLLFEPRLTKFENLMSRPS